MSITVSSKRLGNPNGEPLIFLHGLFGNHRNLLPIARPFSEQYNTILVDLRNHGQSPHHALHTYESMSQDIAVMIEELQLPPPIIVGHSMGGKVAMTHALSYPEQTRAIFVLDIAPVTYDFNYQNVIAALQSIDLAALKSREHADIQLSEYFKRSSFRQFLLQNLVRDNGQFKWRLNLDSLQQNHQNICSFPKTDSESFAKPSFFLAGAESNYVSNEHHQAIEQLFPNFQIHYEPEASHWMHAEKPQQVNLQLQQFLDLIA